MVDGDVGEGVSGGGGDVSDGVREGVKHIFGVLTMSPFWGFGVWL